MKPALTFGEPGRPMPSRQGWAGLVSLFLITTIITTQILGIFSPFHQVKPAIAERLAHLEQNSDRYTHIFVGLSHVGEGFNPRVFDQQSARLGCPTRSLNFGIGELTIAEEQYILNRIGEISPHQDRTILLEPFPLMAANFKPDLWTSSRITWKHLRAKHQSRDLSLRLRLHDLYILTRTVAKELLFTRLLTSRNARPQQDFIATQGYTVSEGKTNTGLKPDQRKFQKNLASYIRMKNKYQTLASSNAPSGSILQNFGERLPQTLSGDNIIYIGMPSMDSMLFFRSALSSGGMYKHAEFSVLNMNDPNRYPALFEPALWDDVEHFRPEGAVHFSHALAHELCTRDDRLVAK